MLLLAGGCRLAGPRGADQTRAAPVRTEAPAGPPTRIEARVAAAVDGDTVRLEGGERVRYLGIDAPELPHDRTEAQAFGRAAADRNQALVGGRVVQLEADQEDRDRFGRLLRHVWLDGELVSARLVEEGLSFSLALAPNNRHREALADAQARARSAGRGLWADWPDSPLFRPGRTGGADCPPDAAAPAQAGRYVGRAALICLRESRAERSTGTVRLRPASGGEAFALVLFADLWTQFPERPERYFDGQTVVARGRIERYDGSPELIVRQAEDIVRLP